MKRIVLSMLLSATVGLLSAGGTFDLTHFVLEGKTWIYQVQDLDDPSTEDPSRRIWCILMGDTIVGGLTYLKYYVENDYDEYVYTGCFREEEKKVFFVGRDETEEKELYDFNLKEGDVFQGSYTLKEDYQITGYRRDPNRVMGFESSWGWPIRNYWIQGVGSIHTLPHQPFYMDDKTSPRILHVLSVYFNPHYMIGPVKPTGSYYVFEYPKDLDGLKTDYLEYRLGTWANILSPFKEQDDRLFDLSGRQLPQKPTKGIYIQGGKKRIAKNE